MQQEKDNTVLMLADQKKQKIYDLEEITIMTMQNNELKKKITKMEAETGQIRKKRLTVTMHLDTVLEELFKTNEGYKLYNVSLEQLDNANQSEIDYMAKI